MIRNGDSVSLPNEAYSAAIEEGRRNREALLKSKYRKVEIESEKSEAGRYDELDAAVARIPRIEKRNADGVVILPDDWDDPRDAIYDDYRFLRVDVTYYCPAAVL